MAAPFKIGEVVNGWTIMSSSDNHRTRDCKCPYCGTIKRLRSCNVRKTKSCGCRWRTNAKCGKDNHLWRGCGDISGAVFSRYKFGAEIRKLTFNVTIEYVWELYLRQKAKCALTGSPITLPKTSRSYSRGESTASLDRIDSSRGYEIGNVRWLHKGVNIMKSNICDDDFIRICKKVARFSSKRSVTNSDNHSHSV